MQRGLGVYILRGRIIIVDCARIVLSILDT